MFNEFCRGGGFPGVPDVMAYWKQRLPVGKSLLKGMGHSSPFGAEK